MKTCKRCKAPISHNGFLIYTPHPGTIRNHLGYAIKPAKPNQKASCLPCAVELTKAENWKRAKGCLMPPDPPCQFCGRVLIQEAPVEFHLKERKPR